MLSVIPSREHEEPRVSPDGTTMLFGLPGVGVRHVERVASHPVVGRHRPGTAARVWSMW